MSDKNSESDSSQSELQSKLNLETAQIAWRELQTFFAAGSVVFVDSSQDMLHVAEQLVADNHILFSQWVEKGWVAPVSDEQALEWYNRDALLWSVVIKPWVLVQER